MIEIVKNHKELKDLFPYINETKIRFQIQSLLCNPEPNVQNYSSKRTIFYMSNLQWCLWIETSFGKMTIGLACQSQIPAICSIKINTSLSILKNKRNQKQHSVNIPEQIISAEQCKARNIVESYIIDSKYRQREMVTMEVLINAQPNILCEFGNDTFLKWREHFQIDDLNILHKQFQTLKRINNTFQANNKDLCEKTLAQQSLIVEFREKLAFYEEHKMDLADDIRLRLQIDKKERSDFDETSNHHLLKLGQLQKEIDDLRQANLELVLQQKQVELPKTVTVDMRTQNEGIDKTDKPHLPKLGQLQKEIDNLRQANLELALQQKQVELPKKVAVDMRTQNEETQYKLANGEGGKKDVGMFIVALRLFNQNSCSKFEYVRNNIKVQLQMISTDCNDVDGKISKCKESIEQLQDVEFPNTSRNIAEEKKENEVLRQKLDSMKLIIQNLNSKNDELQVKLSQFEDDKKKLKWFKEALRLFEIKCCRKFEHEVDLSNNVKIQFQMVLKQTDDPKPNNE